MEEGRPHEDDICTVSLAQVSLATAIIVDVRHEQVSVLNPRGEREVGGALIQRGLDLPKARFRRSAGLCGVEVGVDELRRGQRES